MDPHISVIADFKSMFPNIEIVEFCLSSHAWVMNHQQDNPEIINARTWNCLTAEMIQAFQYKYDSFLRTFDGFVVGHCSSFAMIYEKYKKPIFMINSVRYDIPFCWTKNVNLLSSWEDSLRRMHESGQLIVVANNKADQRYLELGCGITSRYIPSLCLYTKTRYTPTKSTFLCYTGTFSAHPLLTPKSTLPKRYKWSDITSFRGIVHMPYEVSTMSMFEQFSAGCPLFFPSKAFWKSNPKIQSLSAYWGNDVPSKFQEMSSIDAWIDLSDLYDIFQSPNTHYFDSEEHLFRLLESFEYVDDTEFRNAHIGRVTAEWKEILRSVFFDAFWSKSPRHICYNRLPLLANVVYDVNYAGTGVSPQHNYPIREPLSGGDVVFVKTEYLSWFLNTRTINAPITLVTGVSDASPTSEECRRICVNPNIVRWIGCNIPRTDPKILKLPIGVGEPERINGNHDTLVRLHAERVPWDQKSDSLCVPYHQTTHTSRTLIPTLPKLEFEAYMRAISDHKFVVCQRGNGIDTHRVCEVLLMGSVPVLEHSSLDDMYSQWNCLLVDSFETVDTSSFVWEDAKDEAFLDIFWLRDSTKTWLLP